VEPPSLGSSGRVFLCPGLGWRCWLGRSQGPDRSVGVDQEPQGSRASEGRGVVRLGRVSSPEGARERTRWVQPPGNPRGVSRGVFFVRELLDLRLNILIC
jgi:hypothetical protein